MSIKLEYDHFGVTLPGARARSHQTHLRACDSIPPRLRRLVRLSVCAFSLPPGAGGIRIVNATPTIVSIEH